MSSTSSQSPKKPLVSSILDHDDNYVIQSLYGNACFSTKTSMLILSATVEFVLATK